MSQRYTVELPGFEGRAPVVEVSTWGRSRIFLDGEETPGGSEGRFEVRRNDGQRVSVQIVHPRTSVDPLPRLVLDGQTYTLAPRLTRSQYVWLILPFVVLVAFGWFIGALVGVVTLWVNARIFRARRGPSRYIITAFVSVLGLAIVVGVALLLAALVR